MIKQSLISSSVYDDRSESHLVEMERELCLKSRKNDLNSFLSVRRSLHSRVELKRAN